MNITYILHKIPLLKSLFKLQRLSLIYLIQYTKILIQVTLSKKKKKNLARNVLKNIQVHLFYILYISNQAYSTIK